jgi:hypothetical protein
VLLPQERSEAHRPPCSRRRETSRACHPSAPAERARTSIGHTPRAREGMGQQGGTHRPPAAGFTLFDDLDLRAGRKGEVPLGVLRASGGPRVLRDCQPLGLVLHHLGGHGDHAWPTPNATRPPPTLGGHTTKCAEGSRYSNFQTSLEIDRDGGARRGPDRWLRTAVQQRRPGRVPRFIGAYSSSPVNRTLCVWV